LYWLLNDKKTKKDVEDLELNLKLDDTTMSWQIDKGQDDRQLTTLQNDVFSACAINPSIYPVL